MRPAEGDISGACKIRGSANSNCAGGCFRCALRTFTLECRRVAHLQWYDLDPAGQSVHSSVGRPAFESNSITKVARYHHQQTTTARIQLIHSEVSVVFDFDADAATAVLHRVLQRITTSRERMFLMHFPLPGLGRIARHDGGYRRGGGASGGGWT